MLLQSSKLPAHYYLLGLAALAALATGILFLSNGARLPSGAPALPLDDSYIHLQYAWQAARGQFLQYNPGDAPTTGATSLLYMLILAGGFALGLSRETMPAVILAFSLILFMVSAVLLADTARRAAVSLGADSTTAGALAVVLFAGSGWMAWAFFSGMETGLLIALAITTLWASLARRCKLTALFSALAALTRPEAALLPLALFAAEAAVRDPAETDHGQRMVWAVVPLGAAFVLPIVNFIFTGSFSATGLLAKSLFTMIPFQGSSIGYAFGKTVVELSVRLLGGLSPDGHWHIFPLIQLLALLGLWQMWRIRPPRRLAIMCVLWVVLGIAATATLQTATWHHYRYQMPLYPALLVLACVGVAQVMGKLRWPSPAVRAVAIVPALVWSIYSLAGFSREYAAGTSTLVEQQSVLADWLRANTPADARVAVHDVGVMRFIGERATVDVVGLTTAGMAAANRNGPGSIFEALERIRPDYYAVYPNLAPPYWGISSAPDLFGAELFRVHLNSYSIYTSAGDTQVITRPDWSTAALADSPQQPSILSAIASLTLLDSFDVADLPDEAAHDYRWWNVGEPPGFPTDARRMAYRQNPAIALADGGRSFTGGESFTLRTQPDQSLLLVVRLHQTVDMTLRVKVNDAGAGEWRLPAVPGEWLESAFVVPAPLIQSEATRFTITIEDAPADSRYSPFHYWTYQGSIVAAQESPTATTTTTFGNVVRLLGFDLSDASLAPGQTLDVTLYWQAISADHADYKVFLHLLDPKNDTQSGIVAQMDSAPRSSTYPFWVWRSDEIVSEALSLSIPPQTPPGEYVLLAGIYDSATGKRLPVLGARDFGANRFALTSVTIR